LVALDVKRWARRRSRRAIVRAVESVTGLRALVQKARLNPRSGWVKALLSGRLPRLEELRLEHALYAGITAWSPLDIFNAGSSAVYFVGEPDAVAGNIKIYHDEAGLSALILSGWPLIDEARNVGTLLIPRLKEIV
jgi:alkanesulfonate monooxygenase